MSIQTSSYIDGRDWKNNEVECLDDPVRIFADDLPHIFFKDSYFCGNDAHGNEHYWSPKYRVEFVEHRGRNFPDDSVIYVERSAYKRLRQLWLRGTKSEFEDADFGDGYLEYVDEYYKNETASLEEQRKRWVAEQAYRLAEHEKTQAALKVARTNLVTALVRVSEQPDEVLRRQKLLVARILRQHLNKRLKVAYDLIGRQDADALPERRRKMILLTPEEEALNERTQNDALELRSL